MGKRILGGKRRRVVFRAVVRRVSAELRRVLTCAPRRAPSGLGRENPRSPAWDKERDSRRCAPALAPEAGP